VRAGGFAIKVTKRLFNRRRLGKRQKPPLVHRFVGAGWFVSRIFIAGEKLWSLPVGLEIAFPSASRRRTGPAAAAGG
jgi:hypothetical protein